MVGTGRKVSLFPPKKQKPKVGPKKLTAFRMPQDLQEFMVVLKSRGYQKTEAIVTMLRLVRDFEQEIGDDELDRITAMAEEERSTVGKVLARLARVGLAVELKRSRST